MSLILHYHPLSSFCWKPLIALYELGVPFEGRIVDFGDEASRAAFFALWPIGKIPVLRDEDRGVTVPESSIIVEYLDRHYPGPVRLVPQDPDLARDARLRDRIFDNYLEHRLQQIVGDRLRPSEAKDPFGVEQAHRQLRTAYAMLETDMAGRTWATGEDFGLADCAAAPALYYANRVEPFGEDRPALAAYLDRLMARPSFARVLKEAEPYFHMFPA